MTDKIELDTAARPARGSFLLKFNRIESSVHQPSVSFSVRIPSEDKKGVRASLQRPRSPLVEEFGLIIF